MIIFYNLCTDEEITESEVAKKHKMIWNLIWKNISKYQLIFILRKSKVNRASIENLDSHLKIADSNKAEPTDSNKAEPTVASVVSSIVDVLGSSEKAKTKMIRMSSPISNSIM